MVCRQDDNGHRYVIATGMSQQLARDMAAEFETHGHKQLYWIEPERNEGSQGPI